MLKMYGKPLCVKVLHVKLIVAEKLTSMTILNSFSFSKTLRKQTSYVVSIIINNGYNNIK